MRDFLLRMQMLRFMSCCAVLDHRSVSPRKWHILFISECAHTAVIQPVCMSVFYDRCGRRYYAAMQIIFGTNGIDKHEQNDNLLHRPICIRLSQFLYLNFTTVTFWHYINFNKYCDSFHSKIETSWNGDSFSIRRSSCMAY